MGIWTSVPFGAGGGGAGMASNKRLLLDELVEFVERHQPNHTICVRSSEAARHLLGESR